MKILLNKCYGGFGLSDEFVEKYPQFDKYDDYERHDETLIKCVEEFGLDKSASSFSEFRIIEIPDDVKYSIHNYDGMEHINEVWIEVTPDELKTGLSQDKLDKLRLITCIRIID